MGCGRRSHLASGRTAQRLALAEDLVVRASWWLALHREVRTRACYSDGRVVIGCQSGGGALQDEISKLMADVYEAAGAFRASGQVIASGENQTLAQWHLLDSIDDPSATVARAARRVGLTRQAVQKTANELAAAGLLEFKDNPDHKRSPLIAVTEKGQAVLDRLAERAHASHESRFDEISPEAIATTRETLRRMAQLTYASLR